jgi:hypothetical protein
MIDKMRRAARVLVGWLEEWFGPRSDKVEADPIASFASSASVLATQYVAGFIRKSISYGTSPISSAETWVHM